MGAAPCAWNEVMQLCRRWACAERLASSGLQSRMGVQARDASMCSHTGAWALRYSVRQGMQASAGPLQRHADAPATLLSDGACWPMTPPHMQPCWFSRPHVPVRQGMQASAAPWQSRASSPPPLLSDRARRPTFSHAGAHNLSCLSRRACRPALQPCGYTLHPHPLCQAAMQPCAAS